MQLVVLSGILTLALIVVAVRSCFGWKRDTCGLSRSGGGFSPMAPVQPPRKQHEPDRILPVAARTMDGQGSSTLSKLGRYEIIEKVGHGAMGVVFKGRDPRLDRLTAIKTIRFPDGLDDMQVETARRQLNREAELLAGLTHPNIVTVYDVGEDRGTTFVAMEFLDGERLSAFTKPDQLLPIEKVLDIVGQVADALAFAHANGIVHRDIKPDNIVVLDDGSVKVTDFGIALSDITDTDRTTPLKGSIQYMSPEQMHGKGVTGLSDLFSLGVVLFELLTGRLPFSGENDASIIYQTTTAPTPVLSGIRSELPPGLDDIINRTLAKEPSDRYPDAEALVSDLIAAMDTELMSDTSGSPTDGDDSDDLFDDADFTTPVMVPSDDSVADDAPVDEPKSDGDLDFSDIDDLMQTDPDTIEADTDNRQDLFDDAAEPVPMFDVHPMSSPSGAPRELFDTGPMSADAPRDLFDTVPEEAIGEPEPFRPTAPKTESRWAEVWQHLSRHGHIISSGGGNGQFRFIRVLAGCLLLTGIGLAWYAYLSSQISDPYWSGDSKSLAQYRKTTARKPPESVPPAPLVQPDMPAPSPSKPSTPPVSPTPTPPAAVVPPAAPATPTPRPAPPKPEPAVSPPVPETPLARPSAPKPKPVTRKPRVSAVPDASIQEKTAYRKRRQALLDRVIAHVKSGREQLAAKAYSEARADYETALQLATLKPYSEDPEFFALTAEINAMLARDDLTYGAKGYQKYNGRWLSPQEYEKALYSDGHIRYKGTFIPYGQFSDHIRRLAHDEARRHLAKRFVDQQAHKTQLTYQGMKLVKTDRRGARVDVRYRWEVWTFQTIDSGECTVTVDYDALIDQWQTIGVTMPDA